MLLSLAMTESDASRAELEFLRTAIHDLNNRIGVILATSELMQMEPPDRQCSDRFRLVEQNAVEAREILLNLCQRYFE